MMEKFHYKTETGEIVLPRIGDMKAGTLRRHRHREPVDFVFSLVEEACDDATLDQLDDLSMSQINDLFEKWQETTGNVGESASSST